MATTIEVTYEAGVLRPVRPLNWLWEHQRVQVTVHGLPPAHPLADVAGIMPNEDAQELLRVIEEEFGKIDPDDWK